MQKLSFSQFKFKKKEKRGKKDTEKFLIISILLLYKFHVICWLSVYSESLKIYQIVIAENYEKKNMLSKSFCKKAIEH